MLFSMIFYKLEKRAITEKQSAIRNEHKIVALQNGLLLQIRQRISAFVEK